MRRRLLLAILATTLAAVVGLGLPLGVVGTRLLQGEAERRLDRQADTLARVLQDDAFRGTILSARRLAEIVPPDQQVIVLDGQVQTVVGEPVEGGTVTGLSAQGVSPRVVIRAPDDQLASQVLRLWMGIAALGAAVVALAAAVGGWLSSRLTAPVAALADGARRLGGGDFSVRLPASHLAEVDEAAAALNRSAERLADLVAREQRFATDATHQLRTPLTALRLRLETLAADASLDEDARTDAAAALAQAGRLSATIDELLRLARERHREPFDVSAVVTGRLPSWRDLAHAAGRRVEAEVVDPLPAVGDPDALGHALDALVDNALRHGAGTVRLTATGGDGGPVVRVSDEGPGIPEGREQEVFERGRSLRGGAGIGLALARELVDGAGGRLVLTRARPATFEVYLPPAPEASFTSP